MERSIGLLVSILYRKNQIFLNLALKKYNLTAAEMPILMYLYKNDGVSQEEISCYLSIDKAATARGIQSLIDKGYLRKEKDTVDRRANKVYMTDLALSHIKMIKNLLMEWTDFLINGLDPHAVDTTFSILEQMSLKAEQANLKDLWGDL